MKHFKWMFCPSLVAMLAMLAWGCAPENPVDDDDAADDDDDAADDDAADDDAADDDAADDDAADDDAADDDAADDDTSCEDEPETPMSIPGASGVVCADTEPNDCELGKKVGPADWAKCRQSCQGMLSGDGSADQISGDIGTVVLDTWDGDNDAYFFTMAAEGYVNGILQWGVGCDMDWYLFCYYGDKQNPDDWYVMIDSTVDLSNPEQGTTVVPMPQGTECYAWVVGFDGPDGEQYTLDLWITPS